MADVLLFLAILISSTVLYALYLTWRVSHQRQNQRQQQQQRQAAAAAAAAAAAFSNGFRLGSRSRAPPNLVHKLPVRVFHHDKKEKQDIAECIICLEEYEEGDIIRILPCMHEFHQTCIDAWLITRKKFVCSNLN
jgi:E3 ubiquitin-protein ligase RNF13